MIAVIGDLHNNYKGIKKYLSENSVSIDFALQVGDFGGNKMPYPEFPVPTYFIQGNHENWDGVEEIKAGRGPRNLHYLQNGSLSELGGLRVLSLGGNYAPSKYKLSRKQLEGDSRRHFVKEEVDQCCRVVSKVDIFISHEAPSPYHRYKVYKAGEDTGIKVVSNILRSVKPSLHFFGHHHNYQVYEAVPEVKSIGLPYGFHQIALLDPITLSFNVQNL